LVAEALGSGRIVARHETLLGPRSHKYFQVRQVDCHSAKYSSGWLSGFALGLTHSVITRRVKNNYSLMETVFEYSEVFWEFLQG